MKSPSSLATIELSQMVTIWTTCFGSYSQFLPEWCETALAAKPDDVLVVADRQLSVPRGVRLEIHEVPRKYPEAHLRNVAVSRCETDWVWQIDVDDRIFPDALEILESRYCDIVQVGFVTNKGWIYIPEVLDNQAYLELSKNPYVSGSPFRRSVFEVISFPQIAWSDWGFWRLAARAGMTFEASGSVCYEYRWEPERSVSGRYRANRHKRAALSL